MSRLPDRRRTLNLSDTEFQLIRKLEADFTKDPWHFDGFLQLLINQPPDYPLANWLLALYRAPDRAIAEGLRNALRQNMLAVCRNLALSYKLIDRLRETNASKSNDSSPEQSPGRGSVRTEQRRL